MAEQVIIIGAGGNGKVVADIVLRSGDFVLGFLDDGADLPTEVAGIPVLGSVSHYTAYPDASFLIAVGNGAARARIAARLQGVRWHSAIHPAAVVSRLDVSIGAGTVVMPGAIINPGAEIGAHCIINSGAIVEHDNRIADFCHISVGAKLAGMVTVGRHTWIGVGASVRNNCTICENCVIGAGAVVVKDIKKAGTYVGIPAEKLD